MLVESIIKCYIIKYIQNNIMVLEITEVDLEIELINIIQDSSQSHSHLNEMIESNLLELGVIYDE